MTRVFVWALLAAATAAHAQDFAFTAPAAEARGAFVLLEHALPAAAQEWTLASGVTRWWGLGTLETRAIAAGGSWRALRVAAGLSQTGEPEIGWTSLALAAGAAEPHAGAALRAVARADRDQAFRPARVFAREGGAELGAGAWLAPREGVRVAVSAPQLWREGAAPPLARPLELSLRLGGDTAAWALLAAPRAGDDGTRALGVALALPPLRVWAEVRDGPLRGAAGVSAALGPLAVDARVDAHPVLGETTRLSLGWRGGMRSAP